MTRGLKIRLVSSFSLVVMATSSRGETLAFPNAEGFGRFATGGRGGDVHIVTNLNDSGPGSLREGISNRTPGVPRTIVFAISGTIYLNSTLRIDDGDLTIAGQSAPGDGICLARYPIDPSDSSNVIIRFIRSRLGDVSGQENDAFTCRYADNVIVDHCSFSWSVDETASSYDNTNFTMQWCIVSESLRDSVHSKGNHGYGAIWGGMGATFHHNLLAHHDSRNPRFNGAQTHGTANELVDMRNNVIYNWRGNSTYGGQPADDGTPSHQNMINNYYKNGPATPSSNAVRYRILDPTENPLSTGGHYSLFHISGNHTTASGTVTNDNWNGGVQVISSSLFPSIRETNAFPTPAPLTQAAVDSYPLVLAHAGCNRPVRDSHDTRVTGEVAAGTFTYRGSKGNLPGIIDSQADVGGWPALQSSPAPPDGDADGMPDAWESARGLDPANAADRNIVNADGYTNLEIYLNELAAPAFPVPVIDVPPASVSVTEGQPFSLSVSASGPGTLTYQWLLDGDPVPAADSAIYQVASAGAADTGAYQVVVSNEYGSTTTETAQVSFDSQAPVITIDPATSSLDAGQSLSLGVAATGTLPLAYQWFRGERALDGETSPTLDLGAVVPTSAGPYHVVVSNPHGSTVSATAQVTVTETDALNHFATTFENDSIHASSPVLTPTSTNWYVMSSKNATASSITGAGELDLTMVVTSSGIIDSPALFATTPVGPQETGDRIRLRCTLRPSNVRALGIGLFRSGGSLPFSTLNNGQLSGGSSSHATGGTQQWTGYRFHLDQNYVDGPTLAIEGRPAQPGTTNASQSLIAPGTSSSAPTVDPLGAAVIPAFSWADGTTYTLTLELTMTSADAIALRATIHAGNDTSAAPLAEATATTTPAAVSSFDALAIGYRNRDSGSVSHLRASSVSVDLLHPTATVANPFEAYLAGHGMDPQSAFDGDDDRDGVITAFEFILGGNPRSADPGVLPRLSRNGDGWLFRFLEHIDTSSAFRSAVEKSGDLDVWTRLEHGTDGVSILRTPFDNTHDSIEVLLPAGPPAFLRLSAAPR
ncbi:MAG: immunoglobulin domain-containing protein [Verrucomicrobiae bacterium]|nr:immunoglobulin domain-containing protein [Verrucomicrobiae bacterium]